MIPGGGRDETTESTAGESKTTRFDGLYREVRVIVMISASPKTLLAP